MYSVHRPVLVQQSAREKDFVAGTTAIVALFLFLYGLYYEDWVMSILTATLVFLQFVTLMSPTVTPYDDRKTSYHPHYQSPYLYNDGITGAYDVEIVTGNGRHRPASYYGRDIV
jgi:hypothetical protein